ncbi:hypothetical protein D6U78_10790 [Vibrio cholerae]|nr:hypothetical protein [Vibrio cholerae]MVF55379.1 hypothetical protein [Vibrio cholerae]GIB00248.1 hypothetical protein VCSRO136_2552 [Vibrio cholerae]GIB16437.1 hypothetical protein VCSRO90_2723 [Vibrio cholerae]HAS5778723.1 hypothetical protein [Vibrio cholerae]
MNEFVTRSNDITVTRMIKKLALALFNRTSVPERKGKFVDYSEMVQALVKLERVLIMLERLSKETAHFKQNKQKSEVVYNLISEETKNLKHLSLKKLPEPVLRKIAFINMVFFLLGQIDADSSMSVEEKNANSLGVLVSNFGNYSAYLKCQ